MFENIISIKDYLRECFSQAIIPSWAIFGQDRIKKIMISTIMYFASSIPISNLVNIASKLFNYIHEKIPSISVPEEKSLNWINLIIVWVFVFIFYSFVVSPYYLWKKTKEKNKEILNHKKIKEIANKLAEFICESQKMINLHINKIAPLYPGTSKEWVEKVDEFIKNELGNSFSTQFKNKNEFKSFSGMQALDNLKNHQINLNKIIEMLNHSLLDSPSCLALIDLHTANH